VTNKEKTVVEVLDGKICDKQWGVANQNLLPNIFLHDSAPPLHHENEIDITMSNFLETKRLANRLSCTTCNSMIRIP
jgi:hypothetical protein